MMQYGLDAKAQEVIPKFFGTEEQRKRWLKSSTSSHRCSYGLSSILYGDIF